MKVIDLLVDIANNGVSKETKHFKYFHRINEEYDIAMINLSSIIYKLNNEIIDLNDEIEIIEDTPKEDTKIKRLGKCFFTEYDDIFSEWVSTYNGVIVDKLNEIIDRLNCENNE